MTLASISLLACARSTPAYPDPLRAVLAYEVRRSNAREPTCLGAQTDGMAFQSFFAGGSESEYDWRLIESRHEETQDPPRVDPALAGALATAIRSIGATRANVVAPISLEPLPAPLRLRGQPGCVVHLSVSAPARSGAFAFVEILNICGENCASGTLFALGNDGDGWRLLALAPTGVT